MKKNILIVVPIVFILAIFLLVLAFLSEYILDDVAVNLRRQNTQTTSTNRVRFRDDLTANTLGSFERYIIPINMGTNKGRYISDIVGSTYLLPQTNSLAQLLITFWNVDAPCPPRVEKLTIEYPEIISIYPNVFKNFITGYIIKNPEANKNVTQVIKLNNSIPFRAKDCLIAIVDGGSPWDGSATKMGFDVNIDFSDTTERQKDTRIIRLDNEYCVGTNDGCQIATLDTSGNKFFYNFFILNNSLNLIGTNGNYSVGAITDIGPTPNGDWSSTFNAFYFKKCPYPEYGLRFLPKIDTSQAINLLAYSGSTSGRKSLNQEIHKSYSEPIFLAKGGCIVSEASAKINNGFGSITAESQVNLVLEELPKGTIDSINCSVISGWTCDPYSFKQSSEFRIFATDQNGLNKTLIYQGLANNLRELGVGLQCGGSLDKGFSVKTPNSLKNNQNKIVSIEVKDQKTSKFIELFKPDGKQNLNCASEVSHNCSSYWWFDNNSTMCGYREFCGNYQYNTLRVFSNEFVCKNEFENRSIVQCTGSLAPVCGSDDVIYTASEACTKGISIACDMACPCLEAPTVVPCPPLRDLNSDGRINDLDYQIYSREFSRQCLDQVLKPDPTEPLF